MPRIQVYLPDDLYTAVKARGLPASELLQKAVRAELRRQELNDAADALVADMIAEVGEPTAADHAWADSILGELTEQPAAQAS